MEGTVYLSERANQSISNTLQVMFCMSKMALQAPHHYLIGMHKVSYGPDSILFFTSALIVNLTAQQEIVLVRHILP